MRRITIRSKKARRGVAAVEMALVLPVFLLVSLGIIEYGRAMMTANLVTNAAREGARVAAINGSTNTDVENAVTSFLTTSLGISSGQITTNITITAATGNPNPMNQCANANLRDLIVVEVRVPYSAVALIPASYLQSVILSARSSMRHE